MKIPGRGRPRLTHSPTAFRCGAGQAIIVAIALRSPPTGFGDHDALVSVIAIGEQLRTRSPRSAQQRHLGHLSGDHPQGLTEAVASLKA